MKTVLVPLDFSDATEFVISRAAELAVALGARIVLLHIVEPVATYVPVGAGMDVISAAPPPLEVNDGLAAQEERLSGLAERWRVSGLTVETKALVGLAVDDILEQATEFQADYIVLGSHGHGALFHLFSGSVVTGVLKRAVCPVVVVPIRKSA